MKMSAVVRRHTSSSRSSACEATDPGLESKICASCGRTMEWPNAWAADWDEAEGRALIMEKGRVVSDPSRVKGPIRIAQGARGPERASR